MNLLRPIDRRALRDQVRNAKPFPNLCLDNVLAPEFDEQVCQAFPSFEDAQRMGRVFSAVNEKGKVQVVESQKFPPPVSQLNQALASPDFLDLLSYVFDIPNLLADNELIGGGMHETGPQGRLDVHVDFNYIEERALHRRLNVLIYLNKNWRSDSDGRVELWDKDVKVCHHSFLPILNRCIIFETSQITFPWCTPSKSAAAVT